MGAWGYSAFENDTAADWAFDLEKVSDLSLVEAAFNEVEAVGADYLDQDLSGNALAACEVLARLLGRPGVKNAYTEPVDKWVTAHKITPSSAILARASACIDRVLGEKSELRKLWEEGDATEWRAAVEELRRRLQG